MLTTEWGEALDREHPLPEYPRPQLRREGWLNLNGPWEYAFTRSGEEPEEYDGEIIVPFAPESALSGVGRTLQPGEYLWYRRGLTLPEGFDRGRVLLHFGAVDRCAHVWINGEEACTHEGGLSPLLRRHHAAAASRGGGKQPRRLRHGRYGQGPRLARQAETQARRHLVYARQRHMADRLV